MRPSCPSCPSPCAPPAARLRLSLTLFLKRLPLPSGAPRRAPARAPPAPARADTHVQAIPNRVQPGGPRPVGRPGRGPDDARPDGACRLGAARRRYQGGPYPAAAAAAAPSDVTLALTSPPTPPPPPPAHPEMARARPAADRRLQRGRPGGQGGLPCPPAPSHRSLPLRRLGPASRRPDGGRSRAGGDVCPLTLAGGRTTALAGRARRDGLACCHQGQEGRPRRVERPREGLPAVAPAQAGRGLPRVVRGDGDGRE